MAYTLVVVRYVTWGVGLYLVSLVAAYKIGLFRRLGDWPDISRATLFLGAPLVGLGLYCSTLPLGYWMILPVLVYLVLSIIGSLALKRVT
jgi:hypothetical protein